MPPKNKNQVKRSKLEPPGDNKSKKTKTSAHEDQAGGRGSPNLMDSLDRIRKDRERESEEDLRQEEAQREGHTPTPSVDELTQDDLRRGLSRPEKARESNQAANGTKTEVEVRQFLKEARNLGTSRPLGGIAAAIEADEVLTFVRRRNCQITCVLTRSYIRL